MIKFKKIIATLLQMEYAVFEQKMQKLRADKDQIEHLRWNTPSLKGKMFLCYLQEFVIFDEVLTGNFINFT